VINENTERTIEIGQGLSDKNKFHWRYHENLKILRDTPYLL